MKLKLLCAGLLACTTLYAQYETNASEWIVSKVTSTTNTNGNQLLNNPNEITVGPDGWLWVTERSSKLGSAANAVDGENVVRVNPTTGVKEKMLELSSFVFSNAGQDGLMGMAIHPSLYTSNPSSPYVYLAYTYGTNVGTDAYTTDGSRRLRIARYTYRPAQNDLDPASAFTLIEGITGSNDHNSGRMKIGPDGMLYYTLGDLGYNQFANKCGIIQSQSLPTQLEIDDKDYKDYKGKVLRMTLTGNIPSDNPTFLPHDVVADANDYTFSDQSASGTRVRSHIYSYGHRNAQGIIFGTDGTLYSSEHGDRVDDEVNIIKSGGNYGWPFFAGYQDGQGFIHCKKGTYCATNSSYRNGGSNECESSPTFPELDFATPSDFQNPIANYNSGASSTPTTGFLDWPTIAPSSIDYYDGNGTIPWGKSLLIPSLKRGTLLRYELNADGQSVPSSFSIVHGSVDRYRDLAISPDGKTIYIITDSDGRTSGPTETLNTNNLTNPGSIIKLEYRPSPTIYISEVTFPSDNVDGTYVEFYNYGLTAIDLDSEGIYLGRQRSGNANDQQELKLTGIINPGQYYVVGRAAFNTVYGTTPDEVGANALLAGDGDDPYALVYKGAFNSQNYTVLDTYGVLGESGAGKPWDYSNSKRVTRKRNQLKNAGSNFNISEWNLSGINSVIANSTPATPDPVDFVYANSSITPFDPLGFSTAFDNLVVENGTYAMTDQLTFKTVTIDNGATLEFSNKQLLVGKDFVNNGSLAGAAPKIRFLNTDQHVISGNNFELDNLVTNSDLQINANVSITNKFRVTNGDVDITTGKLLILKSNATATAYVDEVPTGSNITGNVMVEQYYAAKRAFRFVSAPVTTTTTIYENWQESGSAASNLGTHITGDDGGANGFDSTASGAPSLFTFNNLGGQWTAVANTDQNTITAGKPYRLLLRGDRSISLTSNDSPATPTTLRTTGELKVGAFTVPDLNPALGSYNYVGNPYQAPVDMNLVLSRSTGVNKQDIYVWDPTINTRGAYVTVDVINNMNTIFDGSISGTSQADKFLSPYAAFFVVTTGAGADIAFAEADKNLSVQLPKSNINNSILKVLLTKRDAGTDAKTVDGALAYLDDSFSADVDFSDSYKFANQDENLYFLNGSSRLSIDRRPVLTSEERLSIAMNNLRGTDYSLQIDASKVDQTLYLYDELTGSYTDLEASMNTVDFVVPTGTNELSNRFFIVSTKSTLSTQSITDNAIGIYPNPYKGGLLSINSASPVVSVTLVNLLGQQVLNTTQINGSGSTYSLSLPSGLPAGSYFVRLETENGIATKKLLIE